MRNFIACMLVMLFVVTAGTVYAGEREGAFTVSPFMGGYTFDGVERLETRPVLGLRLGYDFTKNFALEATFNYVNTHFNSIVSDSVDVYNYRLEGIYNFMPESKLVPYLAIGGGGQTINLPTENISFRKIHNTQPTANAGAGIKWFLTEDIAVRADYHQNFVFNTNDVNNKRQDYLANYEYTLGLQFLFGGRKPLPPTSSLSVMPGSITKGQSTTLNWTSQNVTSCDMAPDVGSVQQQGSMSVSPIADTVYTLTCSGAAGTTTSEVNVAVSAPPSPPPPPPPAMPTSSLSAVPASVTQGDAVTLSWSSQNADNCDLQPAIGQVKPQGSMSVKPSASALYTLTCNGPGGSTTSTANVAVTAPPPSCPVVLTPEQEETVNLLIEFDFNKAVIKPQFYPNVNALGDFLKKYPCEVTVEGHTDNIGSAKYNMKLSQRRADAVKQYLVDKFGIDPSMIKTVGYGEARPVDTNKTPEGRYHNRRVQVHHGVVKKAGK